MYLLKSSIKRKISFPLFLSPISAGFPSPADDFLDRGIDLNEELIKNDYSTFFARVVGSSMIDVGISEGDLLVIDRSIRLTNNKIAICYLDGEFTVKRIRIQKDKVFLVAENKNYKPIEVTKENELLVWGIVTYVIKKF